MESQKIRNFSGTSNHRSIERRCNSFAGGILNRKYQNDWI